MERGKHITLLPYVQITRRCVVPVSGNIASQASKSGASSGRRQNPDGLYQDVLLQSWVSGASRKYWIVRRAATNDPLQSVSASAHLEAIHQRERAHIVARDREAMQDTGSKDLELTSPWMERTW